MGGLYGGQEDTCFNEGLEVDIVHNKIADFMANIVFSFAGTNYICYNDFQDLPSEAKTILSMDKI